MKEQTTRHIYDAPDSIEIGTPSKGGAMKIYGSADKPDIFKKKIEAMVKLRELANSLIAKE